jgi:hypothetical protein
VAIKYKITGLLGNGRKHPSKYGEMIAYPVTVEDEGGIGEDVEWSRKPNSPAPTEGMMLEADGFWDLPQGAPADARRRLRGAKVLDEHGNPIGGGSQSASSGSYGGRQEDPALQARIARSVAQKTAGEIVAGAMNAGIAPESADLNKWAVKVMELTVMFEQHLGDAGREAAKSEDKPATDTPPF